MKVLVYAYGSRGDVQPYLALARGLNEAGHTATLTAPAVFAGMAAEHGVSFLPWSTEWLDMIERPEVREMVMHDDKPTEEMKQVRRLMVETYRRIYPAQLAHIQATADEKPDLIVHSQAWGEGVRQVAEKLGVPNVLGAMYPYYVHSSYYPSGVLATLEMRRRWRNRLSHFLTDRFMPHPKVKGMVREWRERELGLPRVSRSGDFRLRSDGSRTPILHAFSPHLVTPAPDWPSWVRTTGFWRLRSTGDWTPPAELTRFLADGEKPVFVGFGSVKGTDPAGTGAAVLAAVRAAGVRAVVVRGWGGIDLTVDDPSVHVVDDVPYEWLFPRVRLVVHSGGAGTVNTALAAGVPQVSCPYHGEQMRWARRLHALGVGPEPIRQRDLTADNLAAAIRVALTVPGYAEEAARLGGLVAAEDGVGAAVAAVERIGAGQPVAG
jgi:sterol 3beta-glucosyltransferase